MLGYAIKLDTNGTNPKMLEMLLRQKLVDYVAMDFKAPLEKYAQVVRAKVSLKELEKSISMIKRFPDYEFRITLVPKLTSREDLLEIARYLKRHKANKNFFLQDFRSKICLDKSFEKEKPYSEEKMKEFLKMLKPYFKHIEIRSETY
jgi:pyruvate formate lyase activating enzyme